MLGLPGFRFVSVAEVDGAAPSDTLWIFQDGRMTIGPGFADNTGKWEDFLPESQSNDATGVT